MSRHNRQGFLGPDADTSLENAIVGVAGLGGGGSHIVQQLAHIGIGNIVTADPDAIEESNLNRLVGGRYHDVKASMSKADIARRLVLAINSEISISAYQETWQNRSAEFAECDILIGAVDSYRQRDELERFCRRNMIPYIDIGMDVHEVREKEYSISGQVVLSMPGAPCLRCCNIVTDDRLKRESEEYGGAGGRPQVIWPNGVLASTAVGIAIQLLTPWNKKAAGFRYLQYDGDLGLMTEPVLVTDHLASRICQHHPVDEVGDPLADIRNYVAGESDSKDALEVCEGGLDWLARLNLRLQTLFARSKQ